MGKKIISDTLIEVQPLEKKISKKIQKPTQSDLETEQLQSPVQSPVKQEETVEQYMLRNEIKIQGANIQAITKFEDTSFISQIKQSLKRVGYVHPTPIQASSWPAALSGRDCLAIAKTGSGKTCGFLLPAITHIILKQKLQTGQRQGPIALVVAPTRELCQQISEEANKFCCSVGIRSATIYGGAEKGVQIGQIERNPELVICTPGRLLDLLSMKSYRTGNNITTLDNISMLILDEADKMLDMGFEKDMKKIVDYIPIQNNKQTLFYTATWPQNVQKLAYTFLKNPIEIKIGNQNQKFTANKDVTQKIILVKEENKYDELVKYLKTIKEDQKILVFSNKKYVCSKFEDWLWNEGFSVGSIHGDKLQYEREDVLRKFKSGTINILLATDVCGRGIDIKGVDVFNLDFPQEVQDYIHRIGRSGRAGQKGQAVSFFTQNDYKHAFNLVKIMKEANQVIEADLQDLANRFQQNGNNNKGRYFKKGGRRGGYR